MELHKLKFQLLGLIGASAFILTFCSSIGTNEDPIIEQQKTILKNVRRLISLRHYAPKEFDDTYSQSVYKTYMENIDFRKSFFTQADVKLFEQHLNTMDDDIETLNLDFFNATIDTLQNRTKFINANFKKLLESPFDFSVEDNYILDETARKYPTDKKALLNDWKQSLKYAVLLEIQNSKENLEESKQKADSVRIKTFAELEIDARKKVLEEYDDYFRRVLQRDKKDFFEIFVNAYTENFDPHTTYFSPKNKEDFNFLISGKMEGIGAVIQDKKGYPTIKEMIIGSPSWKNGELKVNDKILKVTQEDGKSVSVIGMKIDEAVRHIRGKKGTKVSLLVEHEDGTQKNITLIRDIIENDATFAKSALIGDEQVGKYGIIHLPDFYFDPEDRKGRNCATDFYTELQNLKKDNIKGLIIDLRSNGGGSLSAAVDIAGFFINKGPIVQVTSQEGLKSTQLDDQDPAIQYEGPLVILIDEYSASASEILAAALQDYKRAVIIGSKQSYGKGTVQIFYPVDYFEKEDLGGLKLTTKKFYRINGGSTQLEGVNSDIEIPSIYKYTQEGERESKSALIYDKINPATYTPWIKNLNLDFIKINSQKRIATNTIFKTIEENARFYENLKNRKIISLKYDDFVLDKKAQDEKQKSFEKLFDAYKNNLIINVPSNLSELIKTDTVLKEKRKKWHENLEKDPELLEAIHVLKDLGREK